ncbi:phosphatase PAP2 family protein [Turicibacter sanguinis]|nr:phosphatase PAP2 family protein [Turicibacter sanguinis]MTN51513.1 phosphatase PAP2 family protein [Turicibacter sanguinis]MTN54711.1 phosphatase PAP2 family protein [Turicibacter sanguinis]MTN57794.1 phosphatase PAP2 family protein [Turicibacter sanguinis]MTN60909.1 phosphatase PAP2 family protein [Turicibacter sanguinis]
MSELDIIRMIQSIHNEVLDQVVQFITMLGESAVILSVILCIYWGYNKKFGEYIGYSYFTSCLLNNWIKNIFKAERPIGKEGIRSLRTQTATGYSFPSGHTQGASSTYFAIGIFLKKRSIRWGSLLLILLVAISRLYLGVHYPRDVIVGLLLGIIVATITYYLYERTENKQFLYLATLIVFIPGIFMTSIDFSKSIGTFIGFALGTTIEKRYIQFQENTTLVIKILRCLIGILVILSLKHVFKEILGEIRNTTFIIYSSISFIGFGIYPLFFKGKGQEKK